MARLLLIVGLRLRLVYRYYTGNRGRLIGFLLGGTLSLVLASALTWVLADRYATVGSTPRQQLLETLLLGGSLLVVSGPLMGFRANEFLDISKLFVYPVRPSIVFAATVIGSWFNGINLFLVPPLVAFALIGAVDTADATLRVATLLVYLFFLFALTQCLTLALLNVLRSRRFRELVAVLTSVVGLAMYFGMQWMSRGADRPGDWERMLGAIPFDSLRPWLPPLWAGSAMRAQGLARLSWLAPVVVLTLLISGLALSLTRRAFYGELAIDVRDRGVRERAGLVRRLVLRLVRPEVGAVYEKELLTLRREPWFKTLFIQQLGFVVLVVLFQLIAPTSRRVDTTGATVLPMAGVALLFIETSFVGNILALEGPGILHLLSLPTRRFRVLLGKNLAHFHVLLVINSILIPLVAGLPLLLGQHTPYPTHTVLLLLAANAAALPIVIGIGNIGSVFFPAGIAARGKRVLTQDTTGGDGCLSALFRSLLATAMALPLAVIAGLLWGLPALPPLAPFTAWIRIIGVPASLLFGIALYAVLLVVAARGLERREGQILEELLKGGR